MKLIFRWFGPNDPIPLMYIDQIPNVTGVCTADYAAKPGEIWKEEDLLEMREALHKNHLEMECIESIPVSENIKLRNSLCDHDIEVFKENLKVCAKVGVKVVCYNFMPVFDWIRTDLHHVNEDGSVSLSFSEDDFRKIDPTNLHLPGWDESYSTEELQSLISQYQKMSHQDLFDNYIHFLSEVIPVCEQYDIRLAVHPDDPPWDVFGLPRIVSTEEDLDRLFRAIPSIYNGLTLCIGSMGESQKSDLISMCTKYSRQGRLHFVHLRNVRYTDDKGSFVEAGQETCLGSLDMAAIVKALVDNGFDGYVRPDHGRNIFGEDGKPGYGLFDRAIGCGYITGLFEAYEHKNK